MEKRLISSLRVYGLDYKAFVIYYWVAPPH